METGVEAEPQRKDARRNRAAILAAARELFAESADVPMCEIARRAGVGQGTLYRHFPNRSALAADILAEQVDRLSLLAAAHDGDPDAFFLLLRALIEGTVQTYALADLAREDVCAGSRLERERERLAGLLQGPLRAAIAAGTLRRDASVDDVFLVLLMARGAMQRTPDAASRAAAAVRVLALTVDGLGPAGR